MTDYKSLTIAGSNQRGWKSLTQQKGHLEEMEALAHALRNRSDWPISLNDQLETSRIAFEVERQISGLTAPNASASQMNSRVQPYGVFFGKYDELPMTSATSGFFSGAAASGEGLNHSRRIRGGVRGGWSR